MESSLLFIMIIINISKSNSHKLLFAGKAARQVKTPNVVCGKKEEAQEIAEPNSKWLAESQTNTFYLIMKKIINAFNERHLWLHLGY